MNTEEIVKTLTTIINSETSNHSEEDLKELIRIKLELESATNREKKVKAVYDLAKWFLVIDKLKDIGKHFFDEFRDT